MQIKNYWGTIMRRFMHIKTYLYLVGIGVLLFLTACTNFSGIMSGTSSDADTAMITDHSSVITKAPVSETAVTSPETSLSFPAESSVDAKTTETVESIPAEELAAGNTYNMTLKLDTDNNSIGGTETVLVRNDSTDTWNELCFRDYSSLFAPDGASGYDSDGAVTDIFGVKDLTRSADLEIVRDQNDVSVVYIPLSVPLKAGESREIEIRFTAYVPELASRYGYSEGVYNLANFYPVLAVYENGGWTADEYFLWGECFYSVVSDYDVTISVPADYTVISSGLSNKSETSGGRSIWRITASDIRDFALTAGAGFDVISDYADGITVNSYYTDGDKLRGEISLEAGIAAVEVFNDTFGKYPYPELDIVATPLDAGGMEYPTLVMISDELDADPDKGGYLSITVAHEVAHQWFYGLIGDDQYNEAWLDESFASYSELVYEETFTQPEDILYEVNALEESLTSEGIPETKEDFYVNRAYSEFDSDYAYTYAVYSRGEVFLYRLREAMGTELFNKALQDYFAEHIYKVATTEDFIAMITEYADGNTDALALLSKYIRQDT